MLNTSMDNSKWGRAVAQSRLLLQREQQYKQQMAAMRKRLAFIAAHQDELPYADLREAGELQGQLQTVGLEYANWMQDNLPALESASKLGIRL